MEKDNVAIIIVFPKKNGLLKHQLRTGEPQVLNKLNAIRQAKNRSKDAITLH